MLYLISYLHIPRGYNKLKIRAEELNQEKKERFNAYFLEKLKTKSLF